MVSVSEIVRETQNKEYIVSLKEILTWYPGDYVHKCGICEGLYHSCVSIELQWQYVLHNIIYPDEVHYSDVYRSIVDHGLVAPLRAKVTDNDHVVLLDGHNRVGVALELSLKELPIYIGSVDTSIDDLIAPDSGWWQGHQKPWHKVPG